jgi:hypothetical protein
MVRASEPPTPKQLEVLQSMLAGDSFYVSYRKAGLSKSYENMTSFLERMIGKGLLKITPVDQGS